MCIHIQLYQNTSHHMHGCEKCTYCDQVPGNKMLEHTHVYIHTHVAGLNDMKPCILLLDVWSVVVWRHRTLASSCEVTSGCGLKSTSPICVFTYNDTDALVVGIQIRCTTLNNPGVCVCISRSLALGHTQAYRKPLLLSASRAAFCLT